MTARESQAAPLPRETGRDPTGRHSVRARIHAKLLDRLDLTALEHTLMTPAHCDNEAQARPNRSVGKGVAVSFCAEPRNNGLANKSFSMQLRLLGPGRRADRCNPPFETKMATGTS